MGSPSGFPLLLTPEGVKVLEQDQEPEPMKAIKIMKGDNE